MLLLLLLLLLYIIIIVFYNKRVSSGSNVRIYFRYHWVVAREFDSSYIAFSQKGPKVATNKIQPRQVHHVTYDSTYTFSNVENFKLKKKYELGTQSTYRPTLNSYL